MKHIKHFALTATLAFVPLVAGAQFGSGLDTFLQEIVAFINTILIPFILAVAFLFFVYGVFQYFIAGGANEEKKEQGKSLITYAILGFVVIIVFWGIVNLLAGATTLENEDIDGLVPKTGTGI